jgi:hypothetical protein
MVRKPRARKLVAAPTALALMSPTFIHANAVMSVTVALPFDWPNDPCAAESCRLVATPNEIGLGGIRIGGGGGAAAS